MTRFDVALSFAGEDRAIAQKLARLLKKRGVMVFYDDDQQAELLGENLTEYLIDIYKNKSGFCVPLVSDNYVRKRWTRLEWRAAQARAFEEFDRSYILPIRLDQSELPGLLPTTGYISLKGRSLSQIADLIEAKVASAVKLNKLYSRAVGAYRRGDFSRVCQLLSATEHRTALRRDHAAYRLLADTTLMLGRLEEAAILHQDIVQHHPNDAEAWFQLGVCLVRLERLQEAVSAYKTALQIAPHHTTARADLRAVHKRLLLRRLRSSRRRTSRRRSSQRRAR